MNKQYGLARSIGLKGKPKAAAHRQNIGKAQKGKKKSPAHVGNLRANKRVYYQRIRFGMERAFRDSGLPVVRAPKLGGVRFDFLHARAPARSPVDVAQSREMVRVIQLAVGKLEPPIGECFARHYFAEEPMEFIAHELGLTSVQVRQYILMASSELGKKQEIRRLLVA